MADKLGIPLDKSEFLRQLRIAMAGRFFCAPEFGSYKPKHQLFLHAAATLPCEAARCAIIEDSLVGIRAELAAGMRVFNLHPRTGIPEEVAHQANFITGLPELRHWL